MKIAHKIVQVPEMKFLLRPFIHNVKRNNQNIHEISRKISCIFSEFDKILPQNNIFCSVFTNILLGAVRKKISKAFRYNNHQCLIQELCIQIKIYTRKNRNLCLSEDLKC